MPSFSACDLLGPAPARTEAVRFGSHPPTRGRHRLASGVDDAGIVTEGTEPVVALELLPHIVHARVRPLGLTAAPPHGSSVGADAVTPVADAPVVAAERAVPVRVQELPPDVLRDTRLPGALIRDETLLFEQCVPLFGVLFAQALVEDFVGQEPRLVTESFIAAVAGDELAQAEGAPLHITAGLVELPVLAAAVVALLLSPVFTHRPSLSAARRR